MVIDEIKSSITAAVVSIDGKLKDSMSFLKNAKEAGWEKVKALVNDIFGLAPLIEVTGSNMNEVSVDAGIPPGISLSFNKEKDVDPETIEKLISDNKDKDLLLLIVRALQKADDLQKGMNLTNYKFRGLGMTIGLPPDISLKFSRSN